MWNVSPTQKDEKSEEQLLADFVRYSATYKNYNAYEIGRVVFKDEVDPVERSLEAVKRWLDDIVVLERIRLAELNGGTEPDSEEEEKEKLCKEILALARDSAASHKDRIAAYQLAMTAKQMLPKQIDKSINDNRKPSLPTFVIAQYND